MHQAAFRALARNDDLAIVSTSKRGSFGVQTQPAFLFLRSVTLYATLGEKWFNVPGKVSRDCGCGWKLRGIDGFCAISTVKSVSGKNENERQQDASETLCGVVGPILPLTWTFHLLAFSVMVRLKELDVQ